MSASYLWSWWSWEPRKTLRMRICMRMSCSSTVTGRNVCASVNVRTGGPLGSTGLKPLAPSRPDPSKSCGKTNMKLSEILYNLSKSSIQRLNPQEASSINCFQFFTKNLIYDKRNKCEKTTKFCFNETPNTRT